MNEEEYIERGFNSEDEYIQWQEELKAGEEDLAQVRQRIAAMEPESDTNALQDDPQEVQAPQPQEEPVPQPQVQQEPVVEPEPAEEQDKPKGLQLGWGPDFLDENLPENTKATLAMATGVYDTILDGLSLIPGVSHKNVPKFEDETTQTIRTLSAVIVPALALGGGGSAAIASKTGHIKLLADPFVKWLGNTLFQAGTGAAVDYVAETNQEDDNLSGILKQSWPRTFSWIPDDIATLDGDNPDTKRMKNVSEGAYLGVTTDLATGFARLMSSVGSTHRLLRHVPENEKAKSWFAKNVEIDATPEEVVERSAAKRFDSLDEVGGYNFEKSVDLNERVFGYTDNYGYAESGIRSVDDLGIVGASVDLARINRNMDTVNGRVGSVMSEGALKFALEGVEESESVIRGLSSVLQDAGEYGYKASDGRYASFKEIQADGDAIANDLYEMDLQTMHRMFEPGGAYKKGVDADSQVGTLTSEAYSGVVKSIKKYMDDFINMDDARARAYVNTSFAGQISDTAEGMRLTEGSGSIVRAQEQILDRVEFLMNQKAQTSYVRGRALNLTNLWNRMTRKGDQAFDAAYAKRIDNAIKSEKNSTLQTLERIKNETAETVEGLRQISNNNPEMLTPLMMAYELTNGNVKTITSLNNYVKQSTSVFSKAFFDGQAEIPSVINTAFYANVYNSALSAVATPVKAGISGSHLLIEKPLRTFAGAVITGDIKTARRAMYQYSSMVDSMRRATKYASDVFRKSSVDPNVIAVRDDVALKNQGQLDVLRAYSDAAAQTGNYGPQVLMEQIDAMNDLANHPVLRFGTRSMQAMDGWVQSMVADFEAKGRAFDRITRGGELPFTPEKADEYFKEAHAAMFDERGIITDKAVRHASGEISLNLDSGYNDAFSNLITRMPVLKPFFLFTKTPLNELALTASYNPLGLFVKDLNQFKDSFDDMPTEKVVDLLKQRGVEVTPLNARAKYNEIRADLKGRKAVGTILTSSAVAMFMDDRLHGNGHYNRQVQKTRRESDWKPRSIKGLDGKWYSYDGLGPITNYLALVADIMDNFDALDGNAPGELLKKATFTAAASITDKTYMAGIEPFLDIFRGDVGAINRWSSSFLTAATIKGSSQMAEIARLMDPGMKVINNDLRGMVFNRVPGLKTTLPTKYDWIDGKEVNVPDNWMARIRNTYTPWKESGEISDEKQFLIDIEYDATATLRTHRGDVLTNQEQSEILNIMGKHGNWKRGIRRVMEGTSGKEFRRLIKEARAKNEPVDRREFMQIHRTLDFELNRAMLDATIRIPSYTDLMRRREMRLRTSEYGRYGDTEGAKEYLDSVQRDFGY